MKKTIRFIVVTAIILACAFLAYRFYIVPKFMYPVKFSEQVNRYCEEYELDKKLIYSVIKAESGFDESNRSHTGARGLMQIMPETGEWAAKTMGLNEYSSENLYEADTNIHIGCWYIRYLIDMYNGNTITALAAYNAGHGNVSKWLKDSQYSSDGITLDSIPYAETRGYIEKTMKYMEKYDKYYEEL